MHSGQFFWCTGIAFWNCQKFWYGLCHIARGSICWCSENEFSVCEKFEYGQQICRVAISQKPCFRGAKRSNMSSTIIQDVRFADVQESRFQGEKRSNMGSALQQLSWFADSQESRFYAAKRWDIFSAILEEGRFLMLRNSVFKLQIFQIRVLPSCKRVD